MITAKVLLEMAALFHLLQVPGTLYLAARIARIRSELERFNMLAEAFVKVLLAAVALVLVDLGVLVALHPAEVLATTLGRALCSSLGAFWLLQLAAQEWYFVAKPWPRHGAGLVAHWALCLVFAVQSGAYFGALVVG